MTLFDSLRLKDLQEECKRLGINSSGRKAELVTRLNQSMRNASISKYNTTDPSSKRKYRQYVKNDSIEINTKKYKENNESLEKLFKEYEDNEIIDEITDDGITKLCNHLQINPQDPVMLALSWVMEAKTMCVYTKTEFINGFNKLKCKTIEDMKLKLDTLRSYLSDPYTFKKIYNYCFDFSKERGQKSLNPEIALALWKILLVNKFELLQPWLEFVKENKKNSISKDLWMQTLEFSQKIKTDLSNYDENGAWPVLLDEFVAYMKQKNIS